MIVDPSNQKKLYGHKLLFNNLIDLYKREKLPNKILLSGEKGIGKSTLAYHLINFVLSESEEYSYDLNNNQINENNRSFKLIFNKSNPNFNLIDVSKDKKNIDINQIRELIISLNKSSFNMKKRFVLIDNIEFLNVNSSNSLLKILEEPNDNIIFILIHNNKRVLPTIKSRCLNFKVFLTYRETIEITNKILNADIFSLINSDLIDNYTTPGKLKSIVQFSEEQKINLKDLNLKNFLLNIIKNKIYKKENSINGFIYSYMELYFRKNTSIKENNLINVYDDFIKKINNTKIYNLDQESLFMEFEDRVLNG
tara:strand:- start:1429 stop:2358 length:930 start_codon:yes stop_codon:yes gene_type:complete